MYTLTNEFNNTEVIPRTAVEIQSGNVSTCVVPDDAVKIEGQKKEYTVVGDALFASQNIGEAPQWLSSMIDSVIGNALDNSLTDLVSAQNSLVDSLSALNIANNNYAEMINIDATVDTAVTTRLEAINANISNANATIAELQTTKVSAAEAAAVANSVVAASLESTDVGTIGGTVSQINSSINTLGSSVTSTRNLVESRYGELNQGISDLQLSVEAGLEGVTTAFDYNSVIRIGTSYYKSGFGLKSSVTTGGTGTEADPYTSEFWIDATKLKFTNSNATGRRAPFTIDATGTNPQITFTGRVTFTNPGTDLVGAINNGSTTIDGGKITANSITAGKIAAGTITGDKINVDTLTVKKLQANTGANPVGMVIDTINGFISVYDENGIERVRMGTL